MNNWIKCSKQLPDNDSYVLAYKPGTGGIKIDWWSTHNKMWMVHRDRDYTHWHAMPELPKDNE